MVEVIDFKDLSTHLVDKHDPTILGNKTEEQIAIEKKNTKQLFVLITIACILFFVAYFSFYHDKIATSEQSSAYTNEIAPILTAVKQEYGNLSSISCDESVRADCVLYTLTFNPKDQEEVASVDSGRLGGYFDAILQSKLRLLPSRKESLTFKVISKKDDSPNGETKVIYMCFEYYGQIKCEAK